VILLARGFVIFLLQYLRFLEFCLIFAGSVSSVQSTLGKLTSEREDLGELWTTRKLRLDLCLQLRLFERDALELSAQFEVSFSNKQQKIPYRFKLNTLSFP
jgi:hypothetical protein